MRALPLLLVAALAAPVAAQQPPQLTPEAVNAAIEKGLAWLRAKHAGDGAFRVEGGNGMSGPGGLESTYPLGTTALGTLTLLKCGVAPDDPAVERAFQWMYTQPLEKTYEVSMLVLAIEARFAPSKELLEKDAGKGYTTVARKAWQKRARPVDAKKLEECTAWLVAHRSPNVWRYPGPASDGAAQDHSATQYAMLALKSASRLGMAVPLELWEKVADHMLANQDPDGDVVPWFEVPAADRPIGDGAPARRRSGGGDSGRGGGETRERAGGGAASGERPTMKGRGWSYLPRSGDEWKGPNLEKVSTGSMTASGIAALVVCKSELEKDKGSWSRRQAAVEQGIRDGCAWLAQRFTPAVNPTGLAHMTYNWTYYYLYGCERAGVLAGTYRFGAHDWWDEGALWLLGQQTGDGSWPSESVLSPFADTCFALLFLERATVPLVPLPPKRVMTGGGGPPR